MHLYLQLRPCFMRQQISPGLQQSPLQQVCVDGQHFPPQLVEPDWQQAPLTQVSSGAQQWLLQHFPGSQQAPPQLILPGLQQILLPAHTSPAPQQWPLQQTRPDSQHTPPQFEYDPEEGQQMPFTHRSPSPQQWPLQHFPESQHTPPQLVWPGSQHLPPEQTSPGSQHLPLQQTLPEEQQRSPQGVSFHLQHLSPPAHFSPGPQQVSPQQAE